MTNPNSIPAIKARIGTGTVNDPARLVVIEADGAMWASNRYWFTPASRVAPLLEKFNLDPGKPGDYQVNGTVRPHPQPLTPNMGQYLDPDRYPEPLERLRFRGIDVFALSATDQVLAVYEARDGVLIGLPEDNRAWLSMIHSLPTPDGTRYGPVRYMVREGHEAISVEVAFVADLIRTVEPAVWSGPVEDRREAVTENLGPRVVGILASVKPTQDD